MTYAPDDLELFPVYEPHAVTTEEHDMGALTLGTVIDTPDLLLPGKWSVWSQAGETPGGYFMVPADDRVRDVGVKFAVVKATLKRGEPKPALSLVRTER
jgi:hypothetical protein